MARLHFYLLIAFTLTGWTSLQAAEPEDQIKYRQAHMKAIGGHMAAASLLVRGRIDAPDDLQMHAQALAALSAGIESVFPVDSDFGETRAREKIWSEWSRFQSLAGQASDRAREFAAAAANGERRSIDKHFRDLGEACKSCHKDYRRDED